MGLDLYSARWLPQYPEAPEDSADIDDWRAWEKACDEEREAAEMTHVAHWSYGGFHHFRQLLAASIGISLDRMVGFNRDAAMEVEDLPDEGPDAVSMVPDPILWETVDSPIVPLLNHSDCDGELSGPECAQVGPELVRICESWGTWENYDRNMGIQLGQAMISIGEMNGALLFR